MGLHVTQAEYDEWIARGLIVPGESRVVIGSPPAPPKSPKPRRPKTWLTGPAESFALVLALPCRVVSEMNHREHWAVRKRRADEQSGALLHALRRLGFFMGSDHHTEDTHWPFGLPAVVTFTHFHNPASRPLDDDNIRPAFKALRDRVAEWAGVDDGGDAIAWRYEQREGKPGVEIRIERMA